MRYSLLLLSSCVLAQACDAVKCPEGTEPVGGDCVSITIELFDGARTLIEYDPDVFAYEVTTGFFLSEATIRVEPPEFVDTVALRGQSQTLDAQGEALLSLDPGQNDLVVSTVGRSVYEIAIEREPFEAFEERAYSKLSTVQPGAGFGSVVSASGDLVAVGAPFFDGGRVSVFRRAGPTWELEAVLSGEETEEMDAFGSSVSLDGDTLIVGAFGEDGSSAGVNGDETDNDAEQSGAAYVFVREGTTWTQQAYLKASNGETLDFFGISVAVDGDTAVVGALAEASAATGVNGDQENNDAEAAGAVYVFVRDGAAWTQQAYLKASNTEAGDFFASVAVDGDTIAVAATGEDSKSTGVDGDQDDDFPTTEPLLEGNSGAAYVFVREGNEWTQQAYLKASNTEELDLFGDALALAGDTLVVTAVSEDSNSTRVNGDEENNDALGAGAAYVFVRTGTVWEQQAYLKAPNAEIEDEFGSSVAIDGDIVIVGAEDEDSNATGIDGDDANNDADNAGAAYIFERLGDRWEQRAYVKASTTQRQDHFGDSVAIDGDTIVVGAPDEDSNATGIDGQDDNDDAPGSGAAYIFQ